jgi:hypothetical protein
MSVLPKPEAHNMTPKGEEILNLIREKGDWITRAELAELLGKKRLNVWQVALLDMMVEQKVLVMKKRRIPGGIGFSWQYKAAQKGGK